MANILSVLAMAADEEILRQVAAFEVVTIRNIMGTEGMKAVDKAAGLVNSVGRMLGAKKRLVKDVQPQSIEEQIEEKIAERACDSRSDLEEELRRLLTERLGLTNSASDELISKELAERAADYLGIEEVLTPAEGADEVFWQYKSRLEKKLEDTLDEAEGWEKIRQKLEQERKFDLWQYMRGISRVDGELYCQLVFMSRFHRGKNFAPAETDLPEWLAGAERARQEAEASEASYQAREAELKEARSAKAEAERKFREALGSEEAAREALSQQQAYLAKVQHQVDNFESTKLNAEIELGVLEGQLVMAARAEKKSALTINKLKKAVLRQREKIARLKAEYEENLVALEQAPTRELQLQQLIEQAGRNVSETRAGLQESEDVLSAAREARDAERSLRKEQFSQGLADWLEQAACGKSCEFEDTFLSQLAMTGKEMHKSVLKAVRQVLEAEVPEDFGEQVSEKNWRLSIRGTGLFLIYEAEEEDRLTFLRFTEGESLAELKREREEKEAGSLRQQASGGEQQL
ncbi:MAG: hypothetical protein J6N51_13190 [Selenomonas sp.]|nr:hypothetical protein [Selenomonas sp.]